MKTVEWSEIRSAISKRANIPEVILDYVSNIEILELCSMGKSARAIATHLGLDIEDVIETLKETFNIESWDKNLEYNPLKLYNKFKGNAWEYLEYIVYKFPDISTDIIFTSYAIAHKYLYIKERVDEYYADSSS